MAMVSENINKSSECRHAGELIDYLYGETSESKVPSFESHLKNCVSCSQELGAFGSFRNSFSLVRRQMDAVDITYLAVQGHRLLPAAESLWNYIKSAFFAFTFSARVGAPASLLIIGLGAYMFFINENASTEQARVSFPVTEDQGFADKEVGRDVADTSSGVDPDKARPPAPVREPRARRPFSTRISGKSSSTSKECRPVISSADVRLGSTRIRTVLSKAEPHASELALQRVEEDKSLRLSDMFDQIGAE
jgi:hypothetical protein